MEIVHTAQIDSPIGSLRVASTERGLAYLELPFASGRGLRGWLRRCVPDARCADGFAPNRAAIAQILEYLEGKRVVFELPLDLRGTPFQSAVWQALLEIPYGETRSYAEIASRVGQPNAVRAVGAAERRESGRAGRPLPPRDRERRPAGRLRRRTPAQGEAARDGELAPVPGQASLLRSPSAGPMNSARLRLAARFACARPFAAPARGRRSGRPRPRRRRTGAPGCR